jgi:nicotinamide-nucleotide amidase
MITDADLTALARRVGEALRASGDRLATAESCTAGWIAKAITDIPGSSAWFDSGFVTYSNASKTRDLGVPAAALAAHGAVSEPVVQAMATGALARTGASLAIATSGIAGPDGGSPDKPVGTVWFALARAVPPGSRTLTLQRRFDGDRDAVRRAAVAVALELVLDRAGNPP